jgi:hypothetical protein
VTRLTLLLLLLAVDPLRSEDGPPPGLLPEDLAPGGEPAAAAQLLPLRQWADEVGWVVEAELPPPVDLDPPRPGQDPAVAPAPMMAYRFRWDGYESLVVIGSAIGQVRPAWVATYGGEKRKEGEVAVFYPAVAFLDGKGRVHIDARRTPVAGPERKGWSPDSFAFASNRVFTCDDRGSSHTAWLGAAVDPQRNSAEYRRLLGRVLGLFAGGW